MPRRPATDADRQYVMLGFRIITEFGAAIAVPAVIGAVVGKRLDAAYGTSPRLLLAALAAAFVLTAVVIVRRAKAFSRDYEAINALAKGKTPTTKPQP